MPYAPSRLSKILAIIVMALGGPMLTASAQIFYETNAADNNIGQYLLSGGTATPINASLITGLSNPRDLVVQNGLIYVTNVSNGPPTGNGSIGLYTTSGATVNSALVTGLSNPTGLAEFGGFLYVTNESTGVVGKYTTSGATVNANLITGLTSPSDILVFGGNLYIASSGKIGEYTTSGAPINTTLISDPFGPWSITASGTNLFVSEPSGTAGNSKISEYTTSGATVSHPLISGGINFVQGIATSGSTLLVADAGAGTILAYSTSGALINANLVTGLNQPNSIAFDTTAVPEPGTWSGAGLVAILFAVRRIRSR